MSQVSQELKRIIGWHLEITRRCTLECPACPRTFDRDQVGLLNIDLCPDLLKEFFAKDQLAGIRYIFLSGNLGDPIYHPRFHEIAEHFFDAQHLAVSTNGMIKKSFWERVLNSWPSNSLLVLSIDGLKDTNHLYRVNSKWEIIEDLFEVISRVKRKCKIEWKYILFEHNHQDVEEAYNLSKKLGIDSFRLQKTRPLTNRTNKDGFLKEFKGSYFDPIETKRKLNELAPFCKTLDMHYIDANGTYFPCCWWSSYFSQKKNKLWKEENIRDLNLQKVLSRFESFSKCLTDYQKAPEVCRDFCTRLEGNQEELLTPNSQLNRKFLSQSKKVWESKKTD